MCDVHAFHFSFAKEMLIELRESREFLLMFDWLFPTDKMRRRRSVRVFVCLFESIIKTLSSTAQHNTTQQQEVSILLISRKLMSTFSFHSISFHVHLYLYFILNVQIFFHLKIFFYFLAFSSIITGFFHTLIPIQPEYILLHVCSESTL